MELTIIQKLTALSGLVILVAGATFAALIITGVLQ